MMVLHEDGEQEYVYLLILCLCFILFFSLETQYDTGERTLTADDPPAFLYDHSMWDLERADQGLLRGHYIVRVRIYAPFSYIIGILH